MGFNRKIIVSDIDGTFFNFESKVVERNMKAIEVFKNNGGHFTFATGRVPESMGNLSSIAKTTVNCPIIACNGAFLYDFGKGERLCEVLLNYEKMTELVMSVKKLFPNVGISTTTRHGYIISSVNRLLQRDIDEHCAIYGKDDNFYSYADIDKVSPDGWTRTAFFAEPEDLSGLIKFSVENYGDTFNFSQSSPCIFEFQDITATKGTALLKLKDLLEKQSNESVTVYAVGDYGNDIEMLKMCDVAACPENAIDEIKKIAKVHLCHCNDGAIADLIDKIGKGEA